jgi:hypothetical protein
LTRQGEMLAILVAAGVQKMREELRDIEVVPGEYLPSILVAFTNAVTSAYAEGQVRANMGQGRQ